MIRQTAVTLWILAAMLLGVGGLSRADDEEKKSPAPKELKAAIADAAKLLEKKELVPFLKRYVAPKDLKQVLKQRTIAELAESFGRKKAEELLKVLKAIADDQPFLDKDGALATYRFDKSVNSRGSIKFQKIEKRWYIRN